MDAMTERGEAERMIIRREAVVIELAHRSSNTPSPVPRLPSLTQFLFVRFIFFLVASGCGRRQGGAPCNFVGGSWRSGWTRRCVPAYPHSLLIGWQRRMDVKVVKRLYTRHFKTCWYSKRDPGLNTLVLCVEWEKSQITAWLTELIFCMDRRRILNKSRFLPRDDMHSVVLVVLRHLSVCLYVSLPRSGIASKRLNVSSKSFYYLITHSTNVVYSELNDIMKFRHDRPLTGTLNTDVV